MAPFRIRCTRQRPRWIAGCCWACSPELPAGAGVDAAAASAALIWRRPRWARRLQPRTRRRSAGREPRLGFGGSRGDQLRPAARCWTKPSKPTRIPTAAIDAMTRALPKPIDHFLVQADLTVVVPGPLQRDLAEHLATVATVESAGTAMVYRISEQSIRHALDIGKTRDWMHALFAKHSKTPVPQGLTYLIDDVARRHGQLRIGMAASFVRCEDPALLAQAVAAPADRGPAASVPWPRPWRCLPAPIAEVLVALRAAGFAPAAEDSSGAIVDVRPRGARVPAPQHRRPYRPMPRPSGEHAQRGRRGAAQGDRRAVRQHPRRPGGRDVAAAARDQGRGHAGDRLSRRRRRGDPASGVADHRTRRSAVAFDSASGRLRDFAIHRITSVVSAETE